MTFSSARCFSINTALRSLSSGVMSSSSVGSLGADVDATGCCDDLRRCNLLAEPLVEGEGEK